MITKAPNQPGLMLIEKGSNRKLILFLLMHLFFLCSCSAFFENIIFLHRKKCQKKTIRPADSEMGLVVISRTADFDGDLSDGEIIYEKKVVMCKKQDSDSKTAPVENGQPPGPSLPSYTPTGGPIIAWEATRGMQATHSSRTKMWTFNGALEFTLPTTTSDPCNLTPSDTSLNSLSASSLTSEPKTSTPYKEPNMTHPICPPTTPDVIFASESCAFSEKSSTSSLTGQCQRPEPKSIIFGTLMEFPRFFSKESSDRNSKLPEKLTWTVPLDEKAVDSSREFCNMPALSCDKVVVNIEEGESFKSSSTPPQNANSSCGICQVFGESSINEVAVNSSTESCSIPVALGNEVVVKMEEEEEPYMSSSSSYQNSNSSSNNDMESEQFTSADLMDKVAVNFLRESCKTPVSLSNEVIDLEGRGDLYATTSLSISVNGSPRERQLYTGENSMISATANEEVIAVDYDDEHYFKASESVKRNYTYDESKLESNRLNRDQPCKEVIKTMTKSKNDDCKLSPIAVDITGNEGKL